MKEGLTIHEKIDGIVYQVLGEKNVNGFAKANLVAKSINELRTVLNAEYMKDIMPLMNSKLGFKTDRPSRMNPKSYTESEVKECLIEAVLMGLQPYGNEFNIIAGNCYPTKEGTGALLKQLNADGVLLEYDITPDIPRINSDSAVIGMNIKYVVKGGEEKNKTLNIPIKVNKMMGTDAIIGKATRKARMWLYNTITGYDIADGDVTDIPYQDVTVKGSINQRQQDQKNEEEKQNTIIDIESCKTIDELKALKSKAAEFDLKELFNEQYKKLS